MSIMLCKYGHIAISTNFIDRAVAYFENPSDLRKFEIRKIIEWEDRDKRSPWRTDMATFFSQVK